MTRRLSEPSSYIIKTKKDASSKYNAPYNHICSCCNGDRLSSGVDNKGNKLVWMYYEEYKSLTKGEIITGEIFNSIMDASRHYNIHRTTISQCCSGTRESAGRHPVTNEKMMWEYVS